MGLLDGGGFDWNGNGKSDAFDNYMDMKVSGSDSSDSDGDESGTSASPTSTHKKSINSNESKELKGISMGGKPLYDATKDSNGVTIFKSLLVTALCIGGIALPVAADMGPLGTLLCIFGGLGLSILILKNV